MHEAIGAFTAALLAAGFASVSVEWTGDGINAAQVTVRGRLRTGERFDRAFIFGSLVLSHDPQDYARQIAAAFIAELRTNGVA